MAKIIKHTEFTIRSGIFNAVGDIVDICNDDVELAGKGYELFGIITVKNLTKEEINNLFNSMIPLTREIDNINYWKDGDVWKEIKIQPKYRIQAPVNLSLQDESDLNNVEISSEIKLTILENICKEKINLYPENHETILRLKKK